MTSIVDSSAHFTARLLESGLNQASVDLIKGAGVDTLSRLASAVGRPNQPLSNDDVNGFLQGALGRPPNLLETATVKRVAFEAQTYLVASLRQSLEQTDDAAPRKIAFAERSARMTALRTALAGVTIQGELDPSHNRLDRACAMFDKNVVTYLEPSSCVSRTLEVQGTKQTRELSLEKGSLVLRNQDPLTSATDTEIRLRNALMRRGIALEFAKLASFSQHCEWMTFLFDAIHRDPPPGYSRPTVAQMLQWDRAAWARLGSTLQDIRQDAAGRYPFGLALLQLRHDPYIVLHLSPIAKPQAQTSESWTRRQHPYPTPYTEKGGKAKGKGKKGAGKGSKGSPPMPRELYGKWHRTSHGDPICFAFNTSQGCQEKNVKAGDRCKRGFHVCAEPRCGQAHALHEHASK